MSKWEILANVLLVCMCVLSVRWSYLFFLILFEWTARLTWRIELGNMIGWMGHCMPFASFTFAFFFKCQSCWIYIQNYRKCLSSFLAFPTVEIRTIHTSAAQTFASETAFELRCWSIYWCFLRLIHGTAWVAEFWSEFREKAGFNCFRCHQTEECVMFNTCLPQFLCRTMIQQFESDGRLVLLKFTGTNFHIEIVSFVRDF